MKTTKLAILNMMFATALGSGFSAHADDSRLTLSCLTRPNVDSNTQLQFFVNTLGETELIIKSATGKTIDHDRSLDFSGGYRLIVEGVFIGSQYLFDVNSGRLENSQTTGVIETFICK